MKKVILAMVLILPLVFQSCKKDDDNKISLVGTEWVWSYTTDGVTLATHLKFVDETNVQTLYFDENGQTSEPTENGTYVVSGSNIVITYSDGSTYSGTISGNKMTMVYDEEPGFQFVFVKK